MKFLSPLFALILISSQAFADDIHLANRFGLGVAGEAPIPVNGELFRDTTKTGWGAEGHGQYYFTDAVGVEVRYQHLSYQGGSPLNNLFSLGLNYRLMPTEHFTPVLGIAGGYGTTTAKAGLDSNYSNWYADGKFGLDYSVCQNFVIELAGHYSWLFTKGNGSRDQQAAIPTISFTWFFGGSEAKAMAPVMTPTPTPMPTATPMPVDGDDDHDGVPNSKDRCPNTPAGAKVNSFGCQIHEAFSETIAIEFATGKSVIPADYTSEADKIVTLMTEHQDVNAEIQGYTDNKGSKMKNVHLSEARARSVHDYLIKHGIAASRLSSKGYGEANPISDNATAQGRKENRRVVASIKSAQTVEAPKTP